MTSLFEEGLWPMGRLSLGHVLSFGRLVVKKQNMAAPSFKGMWDYTKRVIQRTPKRNWTAYNQQFKRGFKRRRVGMVSPFGDAHYITVAINLEAHTNGDVVLLNGITKGDDLDSRNGQKVKIVSLEMNVTA